VLSSGEPAIPGGCRVHDRAPTGSGSPVFNASSWEVIALHHKGGKVGMPKLNGVHGSYAANKGIAMESIVRRWEPDETPHARRGGFNISRSGLRSRADPARTIAHSVEV
jgi:hypothetical protein